MKKSTGFDGISVRMIKIGSPYFVPHITALINLIIEKSYVPLKMKTGLVIPVYKGERNKNDINNYRPITVNILSKIMEKVIVKQINNHLADGNYITNRQFGFQTNISTTDELVRIQKYIFDHINLNMKTSMIALDLKKAFETVNHELLIRKFDFFFLIFQTI